MSDRGYVVMTYARTGATYLAQLLRSTGCLGRPEDWFNGVGYHNRGQVDYPLDREAQLRIIIERGRSENGVFGLKMGPVRYDELIGLNWAERLGPLSYIHLTRTDRLGQAISDVRSLQTGQYRSTSDASAEPQYDPAQISRSLERQLLDEARVRRFFAVQGIIPLDITYEVLMSDEEKMVNSIAHFLGVPEPVRIDKTLIELSVQRDDLNEQWRARFLDDSSHITNPMAAFESPAQSFRERFIRKMIRS